MSRKHYIEVAATLKYWRDHSDNDNERALVSGIARDLALEFKRDNSRFDAGKFFEAAGFPELTGSRMGLN